MKIAIFAPLFGKVGVEDAMASMARELESQDEGVELVRVAREWQPSTDRSDEQVKSHRLAIQPMASRLPSRGWLTYRIVSLLVGAATVLPLAWYLFRRKPDVLVAAMMPTVAVLAKRMSFSGTSLVLSVQGFPQAGGVRQLIWRMLWRSSDAVVTESDELQQEIAKQAGISIERIRTIYNPHLNPEAEELSKQPAPLLDQMPKSQFLVVAVGRLTRQKGFDILLQAMKVALEQVDANLLILGEGELHRELEELTRTLGIENQVSMPGHVDNPYPYMKRADAVVVSSRWEGLARVPIEAQSLSTPVVAPRIAGGVQEILMNGAAGMLVDADDHDALAAGMVTALTDEELRDGMTTTAIENIHRFDAARCAREYRELFRALRA